MNPLRLAPLLALIGCSPAITPPTAPVVTPLRVDQHVRLTNLSTVTGGGFLVGDEGVIWTPEDSNGLATAWFPRAKQVLLVNQGMVE